jgi:hypothetical protein
MSGKQKEMERINSGSLLFIKLVVLLPQQELRTMVKTVGSFKNLNS